MLANVQQLGAPFTPGALLMQPPLLPDAHSRRIDLRHTLADQNRGELVLVALISTPHAYYSADGFARSLGLKDRHELNRLLRDDGLPSFRVLATLSRVLPVHYRICNGESVVRAAQAEGIDSSWAYRAIRRLTGKSWKEVLVTPPDALVQLTCVHQSRIRLGTLVALLGEGG